MPTYVCVCVEIRRHCLVSTAAGSSVAVFETTRVELPPPTLACLGRAVTGRVYMALS